MTVFLPRSPLRPAAPSRPARPASAALLATLALSLGAPALSLAPPAHALQIYSAQGDGLNGSLDGLPLSNASWRLTATADESLATNTVFTIPGLGSFDLWWLTANPRLTVHTATGPVITTLQNADPFRWIVLSGLFPVGPSPKLGFVYTTPSFAPETAAGIFGVPGSYTDLGDPLQLQGPGIFEAGTYPTSRGALVVTAPAAVRPGSFRIDPVPGPLPLLGAGSALLWSRRLRRRRAV
ncbi:MAG: hypothetical protein VKK43_05165 [Synechococcaceae cyanobacterium]|nr:hypothetical protein [Synechococcaceae cyanobacterium]